MEARIAALEREGRKPACVIMEAAMMNLGVVLPEPGYLEAVREITAPPRHRPDLRRGEDRPHDRRRRRDRAVRRHARHDHPREGLGGGLPTGAIGMSEEVARVVEDGSVYQVGTYNGNPLGMAAARASLLEVLTPDGLRAPRPAERPHPRRLRRR